MLKNGDRLAARLAGLRLKLNEDASRAVFQAAENACGMARSLAPVDTGELRGSISAVHGGLEARVVAACGHAAAVEFGTSRMPPRPFMQPAAESAKADLMGGVR